MLTVDFSALDLRPGDRVLDLGCGEGRHSIGAYHEALVDVVGVDLNLADLRAAQEKHESFPVENSQQRHCHFVCSDALNLPFADNSFDHVICSEVLEHIPDYQGVLQEINRVLRPDGLLVVSVPRAWPERICWRLSREYHQVEGGHIRIFDSGKLKADIELLGLHCYRRHWAHALHAPFWWLKCLFWDAQETNWLIRQYHRLLVWDLMQRPWLTRTLETLLNPLLGKSVVIYFKRSA
ncbi:methyltransferase domain-containing protein [Aestuariirhabdus sp. Z084]|uniref:class I SAM-dependent methyltransferase n=1 Tax=Aestuariirhabdus haliotis TaxID=2918751 RepID=UPI00201B4549|nr:methyltransferase domain-containing protein [Aestuariirhabdus haliotis]MCL6416515.1 methyltransferase domain-containing protein [Aestuariirhabdus haliotis]MCL6420505.1 methyltransferase domain-containing protein [Aestuariirhabdus haliotis]